MFWKATDRIVKIKTKIGSGDMQAFMMVGGHICMAGRTQAIV